MFCRVSTFTPPTIRIFSPVFAKDQNASVGSCWNHCKWRGIAVLLGCISLGNAVLTMLAFADHDSNGTRGGKEFSRTDTDGRFRVEVSFGKDRRSPVKWLLPTAP